MKTPAPMMALSASPAGPQERSVAPRRSLLSRALSGLVTAMLVVLVVAVLALGVGPRFLPYRTYTVLSGSMEPTIDTGAVVVAVPAPGSTLRVGDIVTVSPPGRPDEPVTHRVVTVQDEQDGRTFTTKGDANAVPDPWTLRASGTGWRYAFSIPWVGYAFQLLQGGPGRLAIIAIPVLVLVAVFLREIWATPNGRKPGAA
jgi:signal peptidase